MINPNTWIESTGKERDEEWRTRRKTEEDRPENEKETKNDELEAPLVSSLESPDKTLNKKNEETSHQ